jgi:hypothetical protein
MRDPHPAGAVRRIERDFEPLAADAVRVRDVTLVHQTFDVRAARIEQVI